MSTVVQKLKQYLEAKGVTVSKAEAMIGVSNGSLAKPFNQNKTIKTDTLEKFLKVFDDLNPAWLFEFKNEPKKMILDIVNDSTSVYKLRTDRDIDQQTIPLYNLEASAGLVDLFQQHNKTDILDTIRIPNLPKCDGAIFITGDSMYPLLKSGDIVAYKEIQDFKNEIFWGEMYLISIEVSGEEWVSVKYIQKSEKGEEYIKLVSQNQNHQAKDVCLDKIRALAIVKASIRINSMS
jgi:phage repressor protein C with HTH and peptisase S24 domain